MFEPSRDTDHAVIMACDSNYLPYALHLAWQIAHWCPERRFDLLIVSAADLELPPWAAAAGIRQVTIPAGPHWAALENNHFGPAVWLPLVAVGHLGRHYRRILALDSDMWFEGGDLDRLLRLDLGPHAVGAARDILHFYARYNAHAREFRERDMPAHPYFNSGMLLYDTAAYREQDLERRFLDRGAAEGDRMWLADQSLMNIVLAGRFAELSPAWNWLCSAFLPLVTRRFPVRFHHFIGSDKPWKDKRGALDPRFATGYATFFRSFIPGAEARIAPPRSTQLRFKEVGNLALEYLKSQSKVEAVISRFPDEWHVVA